MVELCVAVRQAGGIQVGPGGVEAHEAVLKLGAAYGGGTGHAADEVKAPVEVDHRPAPSRLMQSVHVLREQHLAPTAGLEPGQGVMRVVGECLFEATPADHAAGPIASAGRVVGEERLEAHRLCSFPAAVGVPIVGYARVRAAAGSRQDK